MPPDRRAAWSAGPGSLRADVLSGYLLTVSRLAAWAGVSAVVFRGSGEAAFALLTLLRGTIALVGYAAVGLGPAMVRQLAAAAAVRLPAPLPMTAINSEDGVVASAADTGLAVLGYATPADELGPAGTPEQRVYRAGVIVAHYVLFVAALALTVAYSLAVTAVHVVPNPLHWDAHAAVFCFGVGVAWRIAGEPASAALQARGRLAVDNAILEAGEVGWLLLVVGVAEGSVAGTAACWLGASAAVTLARAVAVYALVPDLAWSPPKPVDWFAAGKLLRFGSAVLVAQLADFLYAPTDYVLINRLLSPLDVAVYAPAVQVDAALLLVVTGLAAALFPHAAVAHAAGDLARVRQLYVRGTLASAAALLSAGGATLALSPWLFYAWLGADLPGTRALLPLVLVHTVVGGSSAVGRSVLLGMGRVRALTASALVAGVANVLLSAAFVTVWGLGIKGIVLGTVVVVVARCAVWMPWYVRRTLRAEERRSGQTAAA